MALFVLLRPLAFAVLFVAPGLAMAWGKLAHQVVAEVAYEQLTTAARNEVDRLLATEPGETFKGISTWADEVRSPSTARWHYVNLQPESCRYDAARDCQGGACIVAAIERQAKVLGSGASDADRLKAMKFLVHLVADAHQPLHAGASRDKGGNLFQVRFRGRGTNLHALWDSGLVDAWPGGSDELRRDVRRAGQRAPGSMAPASWVEESCSAVQTPGFYPGDCQITDDFVRKAMPMVVERLASASSRLAALLNGAIGTRSP